MGKKKPVPPGFFSRINRVMGKIVAARGLPNTDTYSKSDPFCVIKGIRSNNHLSNIFISKALLNTLSPEWNEEFDFQIPDDWGLVELVGLKAMLYDADDMAINFLGSEDFLGGCDVDISNMVNGRTISHDLELGGVSVLKAQGKKPRLTLVITVYREIIPKPAQPSLQLMSSLENVVWVREVVGSVLRVKNLSESQLARRKGEPHCIVRAVMITGEAKEIHRCPVCMDKELTDPQIATFRRRFDTLEQPILLVFDLWQSENLTICEVDGDHLGTAVTMLLQCLPPESRKKKLSLQPESQLHERRLDKGGEAHRGSKTPTAGSMRRSTSANVSAIAEIEDQKGVADRMKEMVHKFQKEFFGNQHAGKGRPLLSVEVRARTKTQPMPFIAQLGKYMDVADKEDVQDVLGLPDWERTLYPVPEVLFAEKNKGVVPRGQFFSLERITFIYGYVHGASGLPNADAFGVSDPYIIVEAVSRDGDRHFMHRTRYIANKLNPEWGEAFYYRVPNEMEVSRMVFSVFDSDESSASALLAGQTANSQEQDDFLGRASLDLSYVCSGEVVNEDIPINGSAVKTTEKLTTGFRKTATVMVEVCVERRLKPVFGEISQESAGTIPRRKYILSRQPVPERAMLDHAQEMPLVRQVDALAPEVMEFTSTRQLLSAGRDAAGDVNWFDIPDDGRQEEPEEEELNEEEKELKRHKEAEALRKEFENMKQKKPEFVEVPHGIDFTIRHGMKKAKSLPILKTKFGTPAHIYAQFDQKTARGAAESKKEVRFSESAGTQLQSSVRSLQHKPDPEELLARSGRPATSPAKLDGSSRAQLKLEPL